MAVVRTGSIRRLIGLSGDTKPTDVPAGSTFFETDSRRLFVFDGTAWGALP